MSILSKTMTMDERKAKLAKLVSSFQDNKSFFMSKDFNEAQCRAQFIDVLLECLKWDVKNEKGARPDKREVIPEDRIAINAHTKHPDYALCYGGERKIYIEAKQPSVDLKTNPEPALQVRRYAYTAKMPIAILTDFQEWAVYDTRIKPKPNDTAATARIEYLTFDKFVEKFDELYDKFSWDAVDLGKFDTYYEGSKDKKGTATVDKDILEMIENWRLLLAEDLSLHNPDIDEYNLTTAVQKIIDRILFLRICEDKEIEDYDSLKKIADSKLNVYAQLQKLFLKADAKFNSGLFADDPYLNTLSIQDKTLCTLINALYYPICQYEFSVLPVEILGSIYERFLGKIIRFTRKTKNGHSVEVIEKPEVQKAGGVYYTPTYIVKYIVKNTIGEKIKGKTPQQVASLHFVDPACGSGSFLIGAYQYLLDWHLDYFDTDAQREKAEKQGIIYKDAATLAYKLSVETKKQILLNNIFGVDIDAQAVEVTKLSLFLKLLENEGKALSAQGGYALFRSSDLSQNKILPNLGDNIKCGNSLIGPDFYADKDLALFEIADQRKVNVFDWQKSFPQIFATGGFDCVIGNPPYMRIQEIQKSHPDERIYYEQKYKIAKGSYDLANIFFEKAIQLMDKDGLSAIIFPHKFLNTKNGEPFRDYILNGSYIERIAHFGANMVFENADTYTCIVVFSKQQKDGFYFQRFPFKSEFKELLEDSSKYAFMSYEKIQNASQLYGSNQWILFDDEKGFDVFEKLYKDSKRLSDVFKELFVGLQTSNDKLYILEKTGQDTYKVPLTQKEYKLEQALFKPFLMGKDVQRYTELSTNKYVFFPYKIENGSASIIPLIEIQEKYPLTYEYVKENEKEFKARESGKAGKMEFWYAYIYPKNLSKFEQVKLTSMEICANHPNVTLNTQNLYHATTAYSWVRRDDIKESYQYFLAIANSQLMWWFLKTTGDTLQGDARRFKTDYLSPFPFHTPTKEQHDKLSSLADQMLLAHKQLRECKSAADRAMYEQRIAILDAQINAQVYRLYGLTEEEVRVVEGK